MNLEEHIDILKEYPFKVAYPKGGDLHLLVWWTQWDRGHALTASSEDRIELMLRRVYEKEGPEVELRDYRKVTVVAPPLDLRQAYARGLLTEDVDNFRWFVGSLFRQAQSKDHPVKKEATRCKVYRSRWPQEDDTYGEDKDKDHSQCLSCFGGWIPKNDTVESLYLRRRKEPRYHTNYGIRPHKIKELYFESEAPVANPDLPLFVLAQHFGDHADGLRVDAIERNEDGAWPYGAHLHSSPVSFFFQGEKIEIPKRFVTMGKTAKLDYQREEAAKKKKQIEDRKRESEDANERLRRWLEP